MTTPLDPAAVRAAAEAALPAMLADLERLVTLETPSEDLEAVARGAADVASLLAERLGVTPETLVIDGVTHVRLRLGVPEGAQPRVVLVTHQDTVWPHGTLARLPFAVEGGVIRGPGTFDMLTGLVMTIHALQILRALSGPEAAAGVSLLVTGDEEVGSLTSSPLIRAEAAGARAVFVMEASQHGALKIARKGTGMYTVKVHGRAAHSGLEPEKGVNAGIELAHQILAIARIGDAAAGTTVTPTVLSGGTTTNTVPAEALVEVDVRAESIAELERVDMAMHALTPVNDQARVEVIGGINRVPFEHAMGEGLFARAQELAAQLGIEPFEGVAVGGASDGNFTAGDGIPTLDGLGAVGDGAHAEHEHALVEYVPQRTALLTALIADSLQERDHA